MEMGGYGMPDDQLLSLPAAARRLGVSLYTLRAWIRQRRLPHLKLGMRVLLDPQDLQHFIDTNRVEASRVFTNERG
jgi:excisionase family DNA binding protein